MEQRLPHPSIDKITAHSRLFGALYQYDEWAADQERQYAEQLAVEHPEMVEFFVKHGVDGLHGASSFSLEGILQHGIVPARTLKSLGVTALGLEHHSQPYQRDGVHLALWSRAGETIRYAEWRVHPRSNEYVTPDNAEALAGGPLEEYEKISPTLAIRDHLIGNLLEAREWQRQIEDNPDLVEYPFYPVVYGIDSSRLSDEVSIVRTPSDLKGDVQIGRNIPRDAITTVFAPEEHLDHLTETVESNGLTIAVQGLEKLRTLDEASYGYMLPKPHKPNRS